MVFFNRSESGAVIDQILASLNLSVKLSDSNTFLCFTLLLPFFALLLTLFEFAFLHEPVLLALLPLDKVYVLLLLDMLIQVFIVFIPKGVFAVSQLGNFVVDCLFLLSLLVVKGILLLVNIFSELLVLLLSVKPLLLELVDQLILFLELIVQRMVLFVKYLLLCIQRFNLLLFLLPFLSKSSEVHLEIL